MLHKSCWQDAPKNSWKSSKRYIFKKVNDDESGAKLKFRCGKVRTVKQGTSFTNFIQRVAQHHPDSYKEFIADAERTAGSKPLSIASLSAPPSFYSKKVHWYHSWIDLVVSSLQPFSIVQNLVFKRNFRCDRISRSTLLKYTGKLTKRVESKISRFLPETFASIFTGGQPTLHIMWQFLLRFVHKQSWDMIPVC